MAKRFWLHQHSHRHWHALAFYRIYHCQMPWAWEHWGPRWQEAPVKASADGYRIWEGNRLFKRRSYIGKKRACNIEVRKERAWCGETVYIRAPHAWPTRTDTARAAIGSVKWLIYSGSVGELGIAGSDRSGLAVAWELLRMRVREAGREMRERTNARDEKRVILAEQWDWLWPSYT